MWALPVLSIAKEAPKSDLELSVALMLLQGAHLNTIFEGRFVFVQGKHKPAYDPIPGMTELIFLEVTHGDEKIPPQAYFTHFWEEILDKDVSWSEEDNPQQWK